MTGSRLRALLIACAVVAPARADPVIGVCRASCAQEDLACRTAVAICETKIRAFETWMQQLDTGQPRHPLPESYRTVLRPYYPKVDLGAIRFAFSDRQPFDNATTDCDTIYFNDAAYVETLRDARPNPRLEWLLHELVHPEQCAAAGGREGYAKRWWAEIEAAVAASHETVDLFQDSDAIMAQLEKLSARLHDAMPMEREADTRAQAVLAQLRGCCIAADGSLVAPPR
jgi:hypothetical protein